MGLQDRYKTAGLDVVAEEIDGEVIVVNLANGNYYSLTQSATLIWAGLIQGESEEGILDLLGRRYDGETSIMAKDFEQIVEVLRTEKLIIALEGDDLDLPDMQAELNQPASGEKEAYLPPIFERFTDMEDLLLLDPVHEIEDDKGWPHAQKTPE